MSVEKFLANPSAEILVKLTKNQLVELAARKEIGMAKLAKMQEMIRIIANHLGIDLDSADVTSRDNYGVNASGDVRNITLEAKLERLKIRRLELELKLGDQVSSHKLKGKIEQTSIDLPARSGQDCQANGEVVLNKYEEVPESYRQQFRYSVNLRDNHG